MKFIIDYIAEYLTTPNTLPVGRTVPPTLDALRGDLIANDFATATRIHP